MNKTRMNVRIKIHSKKNSSSGTITFQHNDSQEIQHTIHSSGPSQREMREIASSIEAFKDVDSTNWREKLRNSRQRNLYALQEGILSDVLFKVGPKKTPFHAHKHILAFGSSVFEAMFFGGLAEKGESVDIIDIDPDGFEVLLQYLYADVATFNDEDQAYQAWVAADKYCVSPLKEECIKYLSSVPLFTNNIWRVLEICMLTDDERLIHRCLEYLKTSSDVIFTSEGFLDSRMETVRRVLFLDTLDVSEIVLLKCLVAWGNHQVMAEEYKSLQEALEPLLKYVRFGAISSSDFCTFLDETNNLISDADALAILKHLTKPLSHPLPSWCSNITWERYNPTVSPPPIKKRRVVPPQWLEPVVNHGDNSNDSVSSLENYRRASEEQSSSETFSVDSPYISSPPYYPASPFYHVDSSSSSD